MSDLSILSPHIDMNTLRSQLEIVAVSLGGVVQQVQTMAKIPQPAFAGAPPCATNLMETASSILNENKRLRKDNQDLKSALENVDARLNETPAWATQLLANNEELLKENQVLKGELQAIKTQLSRTPTWANQLADGH